MGKEFGFTILIAMFGLVGVVFHMASSKTPKTCGGIFQKSCRPVVYYPKNYGDPLPISTPSPQVVLLAK